MSCLLVWSAFNILKYKMSFSRVHESQEQNSSPGSFIWHPDLPNTKTTCVYVTGILKAVLICANIKIPHLGSTVACLTPDQKVASSNCTFYAQMFFSRPMAIRFNQMCTAQFALCAKISQYSRLCSVNLFFRIRGKMYVVCWKKKCPKVYIVVMTQ